MKLDELRQWLRDAPQGDKRIYYLGFLAADRVRTTMEDGKMKDYPVEPMESIGQLMQGALEQGEVLLYQERVADFEYKYWAVKL